MIRAYRICAVEYADSAMDGEGARLYGGRWNSRGTRMVYLAGSLSLAQLEMLVHLDSTAILMRRYVVIPVDIPESLITELSESEWPENWEGTASRRHTVRVGDEWIRRGSSAVLKVPSAVIPVEVNYLLNPQHLDAKEIAVGLPMSLNLDSRLIKINPS